MLRALMSFKNLFLIFLSLRVFCEQESILVYAERAQEIPKLVFPEVNVHHCSLPNELGDISPSHTEASKCVCMGLLWTDRAPESAPGQGSQ
jgi:hypothetical protein